MEAHVEWVGFSPAYTFSKAPKQRIRLIEGHGVEGDIHAGATVRHRSRIAHDPSQPNLRQVHLIHAELFDEVAGLGYAVGSGDLGENITTRGIDLLGLPQRTRLHIGETAIVEVTGLRNPCHQIDDFMPGLLAAVVGRDEQGGVILKAGIMGIVLRAGQIIPGDAITSVLPDGMPVPLPSYGFAVFSDDRNNANCDAELRRDRGRPGRLLKCLSEPGCSKAFECKACRRGRAGKAARMRRTGVLRLSAVAAQRSRRAPAAADQQPPKLQ